MATQNVSEEQLQSQFTYIDAVARLLGDKRPKAYTHTFGCQQNEADTERIRGMLSEMGYEMTDTPDEADFILFNTCAVREHAEDRAFGNVGALRHLKKERPGIVIAMCGCMAQQEKNVEKIKKSYPQVNLLFGTHALWRFPSLLYRVLTEKKRVFDIGGEDDIAEGLPVLRAKGAKVVEMDLTRTDVSYAVTEAFRCGKIVLACATYDGFLFPPMENLLAHLKTKAFQSRTIALMENGTWAPMAAKLMRAELDGMKNITVCDTVVTLRSASNLSLIHI